ncbi:uncharacterized protein [Cicer arietinum]|uniref:Uncharacterized protein LOC101489610 n=1 Tax=Cicer arietinum TaxID=3827 RepID=A0A1S2Z5L9_CICAR|nr:uncharacterized protein LOC101489610 [Cicer arietinum]
MFLIKYFPEDICNRKEMEFVKLEQGNMSVAKYAAKFEELSRYYPLYVGEAGENSKCIKFEMGLSRAEKAHYRNTGTMKDKRPMHHNRGKPYSFPPSMNYQQYSFSVGKGASSGNRKRNGNSYSYGSGRGNPQWTRSVVSKVTWNMNVEMPELLVLIVNNKATLAPHAPTQGRLHNLETRVPKPADLNPMEESLPSVYDLIMSTPTSDYVDTSSVCLDISIHVFGRDFRVDLVCLPLRLVDVILGMDWLSANRVCVDFFSKTIEFMESEERDKPRNISANQVKALLKEDAQLYMILA